MHKGVTMNQPRLMEALTVGTDDAEARIRELASGLSLEQQVQLLTGADIWSTRSLARKPGARASMRCSAPPSTSTVHPWAAATSSA